MRLTITDLYCMADITTQTEILQDMLSFVTDTTTTICSSSIGDGVVLMMVRLNIGLSEH